MFDLGATIGPGKMVGDDGLERLGLLVCIGARNRLARHLGNNGGPDFPVADPREESVVGLPVAGHIDADFLSHRLDRRAARSEEHTTELQSLMRTSYALFYLKNKNHADNLH